MYTTYTAHELQRDHQNNTISERRLDAHYICECINYIDTSKLFKQDPTLDLIAIGYCVGGVLHLKKNDNGDVMLYNRQYTPTVSTEGRLMRAYRIERDNL